MDLNTRLFHLHASTDPMLLHTSSSTLIKTWFLFAGLCLWIAPSVSAQQGQLILDTAAYLSNTQTLSLVSKHYGDSIVLRWAPTTADDWYRQLHQPLIVARRQVAPASGHYEVISDSIRLMPEANLEAMATAHPEHPLLLVLLNNCYRDWQNSLYDGDIATMLEKASNFKNRWSLTLFAADRDPVVASAAGMRFVDRNVKKGVTYAYKIFIPGQYATSESKVVHPNIREFTPMIYQGFERDSSLVIQWQRHLHDAHYSAYYIERAEDGKNYIRLNDIPYVQAYSNDPALQSAFYTYTDRVANGKKYQYRLIGLDAFGDESLPSRPVELKAKDLAPPQAAVVQVTVDSLQKGIRIEWTHPDPSDVKSYMIWYAPAGSKENPVSPVLSADTRSFLHQPGDYNGMGTYTVACVDANGNVRMSSEVLIRVPDFVPPSPPSNLIALTDTTGLIRIRWDSAAEKDIIGYLVYAADGNDRHFHRLTSKLFPFRQYTDTVDIHSLTELRYYTIIAVDDALNYSTYSDTLVVERPDITPPSPAWIQSFSVSDSTIVLQLVPSSSRDVVMHVLLRKSEADSTWAMLDTLEAAATSYTDDSTMSGQLYIYALVAYDEKGLASAIINEKHILMPMSRHGEDMQWKVETDTEGITIIRWITQSQASGIQIYIKNKNQWQLSKDVQATDQSVRLSTYSGEPLMAKVVYADGSKSKSILLTP